MASKIYKRSPQKTTIRQCYVFVDNSNVWIAGQTVQARTLNLEDTDKDSSFRVDLGKVLKLLAKGRPISKAILYGSYPPRNDSYWDAAERENFEVKTFERRWGHEKKVDGAMIADIVNFLHKYCTKESAVFIIVTGDSDFRPAIEIVLGEEVPVELWSWGHAMAAEYRRLARTSHGLFTVNELDITKVSLDIDPRRGQRERSVSTERRGLSTERQGMDTGRSQQERRVSTQRREQSETGVKPTCSYSSVVKRSSQPMGGKSRCRLGDHCPHGLNCHNEHTGEEKQLFTQFPTLYQNFKTKQCNKKGHVTADQRRQCHYAHDNLDSWCLTCFKYGHLTCIGGSDKKHPT